MPFKKRKRWLADWRDENGNRLRKSFATKGEASAFESKQRKKKAEKKTANPKNLLIATAREAALRGDPMQLTIAKQLLQKPLTEKRIIEVQQGWEDQHLTHNTRFSYHEALRRIIRQSAEQQPELLAFLKVAKKLRAGPVRNVTASPAEIDLLLQNTHAGMQIVLLLTHDAGLRISEAIRIAPLSRTTPNQISFIQKGKRPRSAFITARTAQLMDTCNCPASQPYADAMWPALGRKLEGLISRHTVEKYFLRLKRRLRMRPELHIHDLRRTAATNAYAHTKDLRVPQAILGHDSIATTARYIAKLDTTATADVLELLAAQSTWRPK